MFAKSPTVAAEFKISGARSDLPVIGLLPRFTKFWLPAVAGVSPCLPVDVGCSFVLNTEPTPFNCVGFALSPSPDVKFNAVVGCVELPSLPTLLFAGVAASVFIFTGATWFFTVAGSTGISPFFGLPFSSCSGL